MILTSMSVRAIHARTMEPVRILRHPSYLMTTPAGNLSSLFGMLRIESSGDEDSHQWEWLEGIDDKKEDYLWGKELGQGSFGAVRMVKNKQTDMRFAAKLMSREQMDREGGPHHH